MRSSIWMAVGPPRRSAYFADASHTRRHKIFIRLINQCASLVHPIMMKFPTDRKSRALFSGMGY
jgi:hypothetical protein